MFGRADKHFTGAHTLQFPQRNPHAVFFFIYSVFYAQSTTQSRLRAVKKTKQKNQKDKDKTKTRQQQDSPLTMKHVYKAHKTRRCWKRRTHSVPIFRDQINKTNIKELRKISYN